MSISRLGQLMRLASTSLGTSTPAPAASDSRSVLENPFWPFTMRAVSGSNVERCKRVRTVSIDAVSSTRQVAATARSTPTTAASAATAAATSREVRVGGAEDEARRKSRSTGPVAVTTTVSGLSAPCAIPAARSTSTDRSNPSPTSSPTASAGSSDSRGPSGRRVTRAASRLGPHRPAATISGTVTPACPARNVR